MSSNRLPATPRLIDGLVGRDLVRRTDRTSDRRRTMPRLASGATPYWRRRNQTAPARMNQVAGGARCCGQGGGEPGVFNEPTGVALDEQGSLQVAGTWSSRMQVFGVGLDGLVSLSRSQIETMTL